MLTNGGEITLNGEPKVHPVKELKTLVRDSALNRDVILMNGHSINDLRTKVADLSNNMEGVTAEAVEQNTSNILANNTSIVNLTDDLNDMKSHYTWRIGVLSIYKHTNPSGQNITDIPEESTVTELSDNQGMISWTNINENMDGRKGGAQGGSMYYLGNHSVGARLNGSLDVFMLNFSLAVKSKSRPYSGDDMVKVQLIYKSGSTYKVLATAQTQVYGQTILNLSRPIHMRYGATYYFKVMQSQTNNVEIDYGGGDAFDVGHTGAFSLYKIPTF